MRVSRFLWFVVLAVVSCLVCFGGFVFALAWFMSAVSGEPGGLVVSDWGGFALPGDLVVSGLFALAFLVLLVFTYVISGRLKGGEGK